MNSTTSTKKGKKFSEAKIAKQQKKNESKLTLRDQEILMLSRQFPNDYDLGKAVRKYVTDVLHPLNK